MCVRTSVCTHMCFAVSPEQLTKLIIIMIVEVVDNNHDVRYLHYLSTKSQRQFDARCNVITIISPTQMHDILRDKV